MAVAREGGGHEFIDHVRYRYGIFDSAAKSDEIGVVVGFRHFGAEQIRNERAADAFDLVGGHADADARAAKQDTEIVPAFFKLIAGGNRHVRVVNGLTAAGSQIRDVDLLFFEKNDDLILEIHRSMVARYDNLFHLASPVRSLSFLFYKIAVNVNKKTLHMRHICVKNVHAQPVKTIFKSSPHRKRSV